MKTQFSPELSMIHFKFSKNYQMIQRPFINIPTRHTEDASIMRDEPKKIPQRKHGL